MTELAPSTCFKELLRLLQVRWRQAHERMVLVSINILDRCKPFSLNQPPIRRQRNTILVYPCLPCFWLTSQRWGQLCCQLKDNQVYVPKGKKRPRSLRSLGLTSKSINTYEYFSKHLFVPAAQLLHRKIHNILTAVWVVGSRKDDSRNLLLLLLLD